MLFCDYYPFIIIYLNHRTYLQSYHLLPLSIYFLFDLWFFWFFETIRCLMYHHNIFEWKRRSSPDLSPNKWDQEDLWANMLTVSRPKCVFNRERRKWPNLNFKKLSNSTSKQRCMTLITSKHSAISGHATVLWIGLKSQEDSTKKQ